MKKIYIILLLVLIFFIRTFAQSMHVQGQLSSWTTVNTDKIDNSQIGLRYIPALSLEKTLSDTYTLDTEFSLNTYGSGQFSGWDELETANKLKLYRMWLRIASSQFEARIGLQKINFGSASFLRPLMWFDRMDPRDPLRLTDGVYGLLIRYYFLNNANIWLWGLLGNDEIKGWEFIPSDKKKPELGGRIQLPLYTGEIAVTFHHRKADLKNSIGMTLPVSDEIISENRIGLDGKWDIGIGAWFESSLIHQDLPIQQYQYRRFFNLGFDYTFDVGNGILIMNEFFNIETADKAFGTGEGFSFSILSMNYPLSLLDNVTGILYYDWDNQQWYRFINWQRMYDKWSFYFIGFWNPDRFGIYQNQRETNLFAGKGFQLMMVFNH